MHGYAMPFSTIKPLLTEAEALLDKQGLRFTDELIDICCQGIGFLSREASAYCDAVPFCSTIASHFENEIESLLQKLRPMADAAADAALRYGDVQEHAFALVEDMALFMREKKLRDGASPQSQVEERLMAYFESCGKWRPDSGELVTETYYTLLPIAVMRDLAQPVHNGTASTDVNLG